MNTSIRIFSLSLLLSLITFALPETAMGQTMKVEGQVFVKNGEKEVPRLMYYVVEKSSRAEKVKKKIEKLKEKHKYNLVDAVMNFDIYCDKKEIILKRTRPNGAFEETVMPESSFVFFDVRFNSQIESAQEIISNNGKVLFDYEDRILINIITTPQTF